jgi:hypothetical protein
MSKLARACAVAVAVAASFSFGIAAAQIQGGVPRKAAPPAVALGVPVAKSGISLRSSSSSTSASGSPLSFASGQPALRYQPADLPTAKDPVRREAVKDGAKETNVSAREQRLPAPPVAPAPPANSLPPPACFAPTCLRLPLPRPSAS